MKSSSQEKPPEKRLRCRRAPLLLPAAGSTGLLYSRMSEASNSNSASSEPTASNTIELTKEEIDKANNTPEEKIEYQINAVQREISERDLYTAFVQRWVNHNLDFVLRIRVGDSYYKDRDELRAPANVEGQQLELRPQLKDDHFNISLIKLNNNREFRYVVHNPVDVEYIVYLSDQQLRSKKQELTREACRRYPQDGTKKREEEFNAEMERIDALGNTHHYPRDLPFLLNISNAKAVVKGLVDEYVRRLQGRYSGLGLARPVAFDAAIFSYPVEERVQLGRRRAARR